MASLLQQLENNEAVLLMYLANELPADDRAEVEQLLSIDANLRLELEQLRIAHTAFEAALENADGKSNPAVPEAVAVRRASRAIKQWQVTRLSQAPAEAPVKRGLRYPWWSYPMATAAAMILAYVAWWGNHSDSPDQRFEFGPSKDPRYVEKTTEMDDDNVSSGAPVIAAAQPLAPIPGLEDGADQSFQDIEQQLDALADAVDVRREPINW